MPSENSIIMEAGEIGFLEENNSFGCKLKILRFSGNANYFHLLNRGGEGGGMENGVI